ncbi:MAG: hypothetical protein BZY87_02920 [SAR202 cluster bacterium Io17-Chloro-G6]|nr:MAG: hypothetical protein BZY87_02920 [SAR202 cluster bacterium Io17-Chloro-G6]
MQRFSIEQIRSLRRLESLLVLTLLLAFVAWIYFDGKASSADAELLSMNTNLSAAQGDLRYWTNNFDQLALQEKLAALLSSPKPPALPTEQETLAFRSSFVAYASQHKLPLSSLEVSDVNLVLGGFEYTAVRYTMVVSGSLNSLVGALQIFEAFPTARVHGMEFSHGEQERDNWDLSITLDVVHQPGEA